MRLRLVIWLVLAAFYLWQPTISHALVDLDRACPNCSPYYCPANPETKRLLDERRALARERGYPQRIVNLLDQVHPVCPACIEQGSGVPMIYLVPAGNQESPLEWSANNERIARNLFREGRIKAYYIRWVGPCECCGSKKPSSFLDSTGAVRSGLGVGDGVLRYETPEQVDAVTDTGGSKKQIPEKRTFPDPQRPRIAQALCRECEAAAEAYNKAEQALNRALLMEVQRKREREILKVEFVRLHNARVDLYNNLDTGKISWDAYLKESDRLSRREAKLEHRELSRVSVPVYRRNLAAIRSARQAVATTRDRARDCETRLCRKPDGKDDADETGAGVATDVVTGAPPARHGLKPKLICGRFPPSYRDACYRQILNYYALAEAYDSARQETDKRAECLKGCDFVHAPWVLADWTRRTALAVIEENRINALEKAGSDVRRAEIQAWYEQAAAFWSESNTAINGCTRTEAERRDANCRGGCTGAGTGDGRLVCAIHPLNAATQYQWMSNLYPPGAPQLAGVPKDTPASLAQRQRILDMLKATETPAGGGAPRTGPYTPLPSTGPALRPPSAPRLQPPSPQ